MVEHPNTSLLDHRDRIAVRVTWNADAPVKIELGSGTKWSVNDSFSAKELRFLAPDTVIGKWETRTLDSSVRVALRDYLEPYADAAVLRFVLSRR